MDYICSACETKVCSECFQPIDDGHKCNPSEVKDWKYILETTKPCPWCAARHEKKDGCNDMFCKECKHYFRWDTLERIHGSPHNPDAIDEGRQRNAHLTDSWNENDIALCNFIAASITNAFKERFGNAPGQDRYISYDVDMLISSMHTENDGKLLVLSHTSWNQEESLDWFIQYRTLLSVFHHFAHEYLVLREMELNTADSRQPFHRQACNKECERKISILISETNRLFLSTIAALGPRKQAPHLPSPDPMLLIEGLIALMFMWDHQRSVFEYRSTLTKYDACNIERWLSGSKTMYYRRLLELCHERY